MVFSRSQRLSLVNAIGHSHDDGYRLHRCYIELDPMQLLENVIA